MKSCSASACIASKILIRRIAKILIRRIAPPGSLKTPPRFCQEFHCPSYLIDRCFAVCLAEDTFCSFGPLKKHVLPSRPRAKPNTPEPYSWHPGSTLFPFMCWGLLIEAEHQEKGYTCYCGVLVLLPTLSPYPVTPELIIPWQKP